MTKTTATRQAASEVTLYRQGRDWIVSRYDERIGCNRLTEPMDYPRAREHRTVCVADRALTLLGCDEGSRAVAIYSAGTYRERIDRALAADAS
jgi:hypothetical protein